MVLDVEFPPNLKSERQYILDVVFKHFLGLDIRSKPTLSRYLKISAYEKNLYVSDIFLSISIKKWLSSDSLPKQPLQQWNLKSTEIHPCIINDHIPVIFGEFLENSNFLMVTDQEIYLGLDVFGSAFFMLTRYEEVVKSFRDPLDRFPVASSLAYQENFLDRPIVNEYIEILWACMLLLWPKLSRHRHHFQTYVSHDVDEPFRYVFSGFQRLFRRCVGDVARRKSLLSAAKSIKSWAEVKQGNILADPCNTFDFIMQVSEKHGLKSAFYFIADRTCHPIDGDYELSHPLIRSLLSTIYERGHEIGLHSSFNTYQDKIQTQKEIDILKSVCAEEGIYQQIWGGRQHCLRWRTPTTWQNLYDAGLNYDTTLSFAEQIGFRCGTCFEFPVFNLLTSQRLGLYERPLLVMEATVLERNYMALDLSNGEAFAAMRTMKSICRLFSGNFTLLWHNSRLTTDEEREFYQQILLA
jgi:hypothetical protein